MDDDKRYKDIELRSEEVQEVMGHIPPTILRYGITVILCTLLFLLVGSAFFSYPDKISSTFTLTTQNPPAYLTTASGGRIEKLYVKNGETVKEGEYIAVFESTSNTEQILYLRELLDRWVSAGSRPELLKDLLSPNLMQLGSVQAEYSACLNAWNTYLQHMQESRLYETELINTIAGLNNAIKEWGKNYLLVAPTNGEVAFMQLWKNKQIANAGETMFVIIPTEQSEPIGKALIPMQAAVRISLGQRAIIRLEGFSEQEFGLLEGRVKSISPVPDENGNFVAEIFFPNGLITNYAKKLPVMKIMTGTADIVTRDRSLLQRLINF